MEEEDDWYVRGAVGGSSVSMAIFSLRSTHHHQPSPPPSTHHPHPSLHTPPLPSHTTPPSTHHHHPIPPHTTLTPSLHTPPSPLPSTTSPHPIPPPLALVPSLHTPPSLHTATPSLCCLLPSAQKSVPPATPLATCPWPTATRGRGTWQSRPRTLGTTRRWVQVVVGLGRTLCMAT